MAYLYFTVAAIFLYFFSDWILNLIEQRLGKRLQYRSVIFFVIIMVLAMGSFEIIDRIVGEPPQVTSSPEEILAPNPGTPGTNLETDAHNN